MPNESMFNAVPSAPDEGTMTNLPESTANDVDRAPHQPSHRAHEQNRQWLNRTTMRVPWSTRVMFLLASMGSLALLIVAWRLDPHPSGIGTHTSLGFSPCGWIVNANLPCPTCGMTTSFSNAAHGHWITGILAQPMGFLLAVSCAVVFWLGMYIGITGAPAHRCFEPLLRPSVVWGLSGLAFLAWMYKIWAHQGGMLFG